MAYLFWVLLVAESWGGVVTHFSVVDREIGFCLKVMRRVLCSVRRAAKYQDGGCL